MLFHWIQLRKPKFIPFSIYVSLVIFNSVCDGAVVVSLDQPSYTITAGQSVTMSCIGANLNVDDVVWQYYPIGNNSAATVIYLQNSMKNGKDKFTVTATQTSVYSIASTLTINKADVSDGYYAYQCICNIYTACASGNKAAATASLNILTTTTTTTTQLPRKPKVS